jgi:hypothetical protein
MQKILSKIAMFFVVLFGFDKEETQNKNLNKVAEVIPHAINPIPVPRIKVVPRIVAVGHGRLNYRQQRTGKVLSARIVMRYRNGFDVRRGNQHFFLGRNATLDLMGS